MVATMRRARRQNAGSKMTMMIEEERAKIEGGEAAASSDEDEDFARKDGDAEDIVDSDFEETDSEAEQAEDEQAKQAEATAEKAERRKQRKLARKQRIVPQFAGAKRATSSEQKPKAEQAAGTMRRKKQAEFAVRFSSRASAVRKAQETEALEQERSLLAAVKRRRRKPSTPATQALTQEQLLAEAKLTEIANLEKLRDFQEQEAEEKQLQRQAARRSEPLMIRPVAHWASSAAGTTYALQRLDDSHFSYNPWATRAPPRPPKICPVTGLPARYFHPRAKVPYANAKAYRILEELVAGKHAYIYDMDLWSSTEAATASTSCTLHV
ncbi:Vacuolar protein sorting-associated protein 72 [Coemansia sp. RSA 552]|nr:Vacuolar protein sorting-associated protein 72 [Coemansia sp. RSA 552]